MMNNNKSCLYDCERCLLRLVAFQFVTKNEVDTLCRDAIQLKFEKGENILKQGNKFTHIVFLSKGRIKLNYQEANGKNVILTVVNSPNILGGANIFNEDLNIFSFTAIEECEACLLDVSVLKRLVLQNSNLTLKLLEFISNMFKDSIFNFISLAHKHVNGRVAEILIYLSKKIYRSDSFILTLTRKELSEYVGCSQENIINTLSKFHKEGIIKTEGKKIEILDFKKLQEISRVG
ncbi:MAG: Crp/Fnr family transcriptional regulator [Bacteroidia bacterium]|nr:Crp/Fnr family transcriptional regulator [Bacteroidia bacterium]